MNETPTAQTAESSPRKQDHAVAITAIVSTALVLLACIAGCTGVLVIAAMHLH